MPVELETEVLPAPETTAKPRRGRPPGTKNKPKVSIDLEKELNEKISEVLAVPITFVSPIAAAVLEERKEKTSRAFVKLASKHPQFNAALLAFLEGTAYLDLFGTVLGMAIGFAVDHGQMEPSALPATIFRIDEIVMELYPPEDSEPHQNGNGNLPPARGLLSEI